MAAVVFFHAHPDDEAIVTGGTMALLAAAGHRVVLVTATRGELGEVAAGVLAPGESLSDRRTRELSAACEALGVSRLEFLGYQDSGMAGEASNEDPACFWKADLDEAATRLAAILTEENAEVLTVYDEHGSYGHPDHIQVHRVGVRGAQIAGTPRVYMATQNRNAIRRLLDALPDASAEERAAATHLGVPEERITTVLDVREFVESKRAAMRAHESQIPETSFFLSLPDDVFRTLWGTEWYIRIGADPTTPVDHSLLD
jgi:LmbE family N-acetylglucosaminyl deacetylase